MANSIKKNPPSLAKYILVSFGVFLAACSGETEKTSPIPENGSAVEIRKRLEDRNQEFKRDIIQVSNRVYTAVGYGWSPVSMIVGDDGIIIIDTDVDTDSAEAVLADFRDITDKPIKAIIFTHGHGDHTGGASVFFKDGVEVWAREPFNTEEKPFQKAGLSIQNKRGLRQFGWWVPEEGIDHVGVVSRYVPNIDPESPVTVSSIKPTQTFEQGTFNLNIAGLSLELVAANGETSDQLFVWFEGDRVLFAGDNFYKSWPNLYAIRGTPYRDVQAWIESLSKMLDKKPRHLVGGHTRPILGEAEVIEVLTNYRDAVKYVFDKTIEGMNKGLTPDELVEYARLPKEFRYLDFLRPYYGHPDWGVRSIFNGYLGWFDGNPTNLFPLSSTKEAQKITALSGGQERLETAMKTAISDGEYQWALQLSDYLLELTPDDRGLMRRKAEILDDIAQETLNLTARNYYRSYAFELREKASQ